MKTKKTMLCVLGFMLLFTVAAASAADAPKLTFKFTTINVPGALRNVPDDINNAGVTVGLYVDSSDVQHGYILKGKNLTTLDDPNGTNTAANGINFNGAVMVVGSYTNSSRNSVGFLYKDGKFTDIPGPTGATSSYANGINDQGWIVGDYEDSRGNYHGFLLQGDTYTTLDRPGATGSFATGINNKGNIVLGWWSSIGVYYKGAITKDLGKTYHRLKVPHTGTLGSIPSDINNEGDIVFYWYETSRAHLSALLHAGTYYKFNYPKAYQSAGNGINDRNTIVGPYQLTEGGTVSGYKATFK